jgi:hypothetical protein
MHQPWQSLEAHQHHTNLDSDIVILGRITCILNDLIAASVNSASRYTSGKRELRASTLQR